MVDGEKVMVKLSSAVVYLYNLAAGSGTALPKPKKKDHVLLNEASGAQVAGAWSHHI